MTFLIVLMLVVGLFLSGFFSGSETGFYRATRVRLRLDALAGDPVSRGLVWLTNNPAVFVATTLVGNNLANYLTTLAIVLGTQRLFASDGYMIDIFAPIVLSPFVFVYGELFPKNLFFLAPNRLLRAGGPLFLFCGILFTPISVVLWLLGRVLRWLFGEAPENLKLSLARKELQRLLEEGHEVGILMPAQRQLAQGMFAMASHNVQRYCTPITRTPSIRVGTNKREVLRLAHRHRAPYVLVTEGRHRRPVGYVGILDLHRDDAEEVIHYRPLPSFRSDESPITTLMKMQSNKDMLARVVNSDGSTLGLLTAKRLTEPLLAKQ